MQGFPQEKTWPDDQISILWDTQKTGQFKTPHELLNPKNNCSSKLNPPGSQWPKGGGHKPRTFLLRWMQILSPITLWSSGIALIVSAEYVEFAVRTHACPVSEYIDYSVRTASLGPVLGKFWVPLTIRYHFSYHQYYRGTRYQLELCFEKLPNRRAIWFGHVKGTS